jgi:purine-binding chemotaxis protein CheW
LKNVIVFALGKARLAVELRWVREVITLGWVTPVPHAPGAVAGVVNYHGAIMPVIDVSVAAQRTAGPARAHPGEGAVVIEVEDVRAALRLSSVEAVATLVENDGGALVDARGQEVELLDPPALVAMLSTASAGSGRREGQP